MSNKKLRAVIIEDSITSLEVLIHLLKEFCNNDVEIIGTAECYDSGVKIIREKKPELVFLDIELPGGSGFDILAALDEKERDFAVICTTDYERYALQALKENVVDFLTKPIDIDDLMEAVQKAKLNREKESAYIRKKKNSLFWNT